METEPTPSKKTIAERLSTYVPLFVAVLSLTVSVWSAYQTRTHNRLSVRPLLSVYAVAGYTDENVGIFIENVGPGPAILGNLQIWFKNSKSSWTEISTSNSNIFQDISNIGQADKLEGVALKSGSKDYLYSTPLSNVRDLGQFEKLIDNVGLAIRYCSIYDECRVLKLGPQP